MATIFLSHRLRVRSTTTTTTTTTRANDSIRPRAPRQSNRFESNASLSPARPSVRRVDDDKRRSRARAIDRRTTRVGVYGSTTDRERERIILKCVSARGNDPRGVCALSAEKGTVYVWLYSIRVCVRTRWEISEDFLGL